MGYRSVYQDDTWYNRTMMNGVYELRPGESWISKLKYGQLPEYLKPGDAIQQNSQKAASMVPHSGLRSRKRKQVCRMR